MSVFLDFVGEATEVSFRAFHGEPVIGSFEATDQSGDLASLTGTWTCIIYSNGTQVATLTNGSGFTISGSVLALYNEQISGLVPKGIYTWYMKRVLAGITTPIFKGDLILL